VKDFSQTIRFLPTIEIGQVVSWQSIGGFFKKRIVADRDYYDYQDIPLFRNA